MTGSGCLHFRSLPFPCSQFPFLSIFILNFVTNSHFHGIHVRFPVPSCYLIPVVISTFTRCTRRRWRRKNDCRPRWCRRGPRRVRVHREHKLEWLTPGFSRIAPSTYSLPPLTPCNPHTYIPEFLRVKPKFLYADFHKRKFRSATVAGADRETGMPRESFGLSNNRDMSR